jgi:UDP-N-acetylmuramate dehydrogenase
VLKAETALQIDRAVSLAPYTTLELGGAAEYFALISARAQLLEALEWARAQGQPITILGGGSNVVVSDRGVPGLVLKLATRGISVTRLEADAQLVEAQAGENWDGVVQLCVDAELAGVECLSGIPGSVGAGPIQNIGAYGQELAQVVQAVEVLDIAQGTTHWVERSDCQFDYRMSRWKRQPGREIVLAVRLALRASTGGHVHGHARSETLYPELAKALPADSKLSLNDIRLAVLGLRRGKSMLLDAGSIHDENRRSVGSFFLNPVVSPETARAVLDTALRSQLIRTEHELPRYPQASGEIKLSAAWLIERSGTAKGERHGQVGVSTKHTLALVHHGGASTRDLLALANLLQTRVQNCFEIALTPEPVLLGFEP